MSEEPGPCPNPSPMLHRFPGAVHSPWKCPACGFLHLVYKFLDPGMCSRPGCGQSMSAHRFTPKGPLRPGTRGDLWVQRETGEKVVCYTDILILMPPREPKNGGHD